MSTYQVKELFAQVAAGDETAFRGLFDLYKGRVYAAALHLTRDAFSAEELTQEVFIALWTSRERLPAVEQPDSYIYRAIYNKANAFFQKQANEARVLKTFARTHPAASHETEETIVYHESRQLLGEAISQLSPQRKAVYQLSREQGLSYEEIAESLNISPNTVRNHLVEASKQIRQYLTDAGVAAVVAGVLTHFFRH